MVHWPFEVVEKDGSPLIKVEYLGETKTFSPQEISSMVLSKMKEIAEAKLGKTVKKAVVTSVASLQVRHPRLTLLSLQRTSIFQRFTAPCYKGRRFYFRT